MGPTHLRWRRQEIANGPLGARGARDLAGTPLGAQSNRVVPPKAA
jgi:hypothetical protein